MTYTPWPASPPAVGDGEGVTVHNQLTGRTTAGAHPATAVSISAELQDALGADVEAALTALAASGGSVVRAAGIFAPLALPMIGGSIADGVVSLPAFAALPAGAIAVVWDGDYANTDGVNGIYVHTTGGDFGFDRGFDEAQLNLIVGANFADPLSNGALGLFAVSTFNGVDWGLGGVGGSALWTRDGVAVVALTVAVDVDGLFDPTAPNQAPLGMMIALVNQSANPTWNGLYVGMTPDPNDMGTWQPVAKVADLPGEHIILADRLSLNADELGVGGVEGPFLLRYPYFGVGPQAGGYGYTNLSSSGGGSVSWEDVTGRPGWLTEGDGFGGQRWHEVTAIIFGGASNTFIDVDGSWSDYEVQGYTPEVGDSVFIASHPDGSKIGVYVVTEAGPWTKQDGDVYGLQPVFYAWKGANRFRPFRGYVTPGAEGQASPLDGPQLYDSDVVGKFRGTAQALIWSRTWPDGASVPTEWEDGYGRLKSTDDIADLTRVLLAWPQEHTDGRYWPAGLYQWNVPEVGDPWLDLLAELGPFDWCYVQGGPLGPRVYQHPGWNAYLRPGGANGEASEAYPTRVSFAVNWQNQDLPVEDPYVGIADYASTPVDGHTFAASQRVLVFNALDYSMNGLWVVGAEGQPWQRWEHGGVWFGQSGRKRLVHITDGAYEGQLFFRDTDITDNVNDWYRIMLPERVAEWFGVGGNTVELNRSHVGKIVELDNGAAPQTVVVTPGNESMWEIGTVIRFVQTGTGTVTFEGDVGVTLRNAGDLSGQYAEATLRCRAQNEWVLTGDIV